FSFSRHSWFLFPSHEVLPDLVFLPVGRNKVLPTQTPRQYWLPLPRRLGISSLLFFQGFRCVPLPRLSASSPPMLAGHFQSAPCPSIVRVLIPLLVLYIRDSPAS